MTSIPGLQREMASEQARFVSSDATPEQLADLLTLATRRETYVWGDADTLALVELYGQFLSSFTILRIRRSDRNCTK